MRFTEIKARDDEYVANTYGRFPVALLKGQNATCEDAEGKTYIDLTSGIGVNSLGFCDPQWAAAVTEQLNTLQHTSNLFYTAPCGEVAEALCHMTGMKKVFFGNSGAEANEGMIKCARKYSFEKYGEGRATIVTLRNSFHGRTMATLKATGQDSFHAYFGPFPEGFVYARANDVADTLQKLGEKGVCALMLEMVQGEGGVVPLDKAYVQAVAAFCRANDILLLVDEVQTGVGRTGSLYAYMQFGIQPDVVSSAKGLAGGLPIGAILFAERTQGVLRNHDHGSTFGGTPLVCAGAKAVLSRMTPEMMDSIKAKGKYITEKLLSMPHVSSVTGMGLMLGVELDGVKAGDVALKGIGKGVLTLTAKEKLRLLPPLTITYEEIDTAMDALCATLKEM